MSVLKNAASCSNIPGTKSFLSRSKSMCRDKKRTSKSVDRLSVPKLSLERKSSFGGSSALSVGGSKKKVYTTPLSGTSAYRSRSITPSTSRKSPFNGGSAKKITDPKVISQQFSKLRSFLQGHPNCSEEIMTALKPFSINSFVYIMNLLLKEISAHIEITTSNYKELVVDILKKLHYPGLLSTSLFKSVNTNYAWPQIVTIFVWLIDLILLIRRVDMPVSPELENDQRYQKLECLTQYIITKYYKFNQGEDTEAIDKEFVTNFAAILNIDDNERIQIMKKVEDLKTARDDKLKSIEKEKIKIDNMKKEIQDMKDEMNQYYSTKGENDDIKAKNDLLKDKRDRLRVKVDAKRKSFETLNSKIQNQPCSYKEKKRILRNNEELRFTIGLIKEAIRVKTEQKDSYESKFFEAKKKIKSECYRINNELLKLAYLESELKCLYIDIENCNDENLANVLSNALSNFDKFKQKLKDEVEYLKEENQAAENKIKVLKNEKEMIASHLNELIETEKSVTEKINQLIVDNANNLQVREEHVRNFHEEILKLKTIETDYAKMEKEYKDVKERNERVAQHFEKQKFDCLEFFKELNDIMLDKLKNMNDVCNDVVLIMQERLLKIRDNQSNIIKDLKKLEEIRK